MKGFDHEHFIKIVRQGSTAAYAVERKGCERERMSRCAGRQAACPLSEKKVFVLMPCREMCLSHPTLYSDQWETDSVAKLVNRARDE